MMSIIGGFETYVRTELCLSKETLSAYIRDVKEFLGFAGAQKLNAQLVEKFIDTVEKRGLKESTVRRKCMSIRCLCHHLISLGLLDNKTLGMIDPIRVERKTLDESDIIEDRDINALLFAMENRTPKSRAINVRRDVALILIMYHSGLRVSELCNLNLGDINLKRREIRVRGKGGYERVVPTTHRCAEAVAAYLDSERLSETVAIFVKSDGQRITRRGVSDMLMSLSLKIGMKLITAHTLRRSCATLLMNRGVEIEFVKAILGHRHLSTTQTYLATSNSRLMKVHQSCHPFGEKNETE